MNGVMLIDKAQGMTSHDVVARARRALGTRAIGHAGTLDPMATGLLILLVGHATRLNEYVLHHDKTYVATLKLGERTDTDDAEGRVLSVRAVPPVSRDSLNDLARRFVGGIEQVPPQFSAISRNGQRAYVLARRGEEVQLAARRVHIFQLRFVACDPPLASFEMTCGSGTYVRSLARDVGEALGCGAHLVALRRTRTGNFDVANACPTDAISADRLLPAEAAAAHLPRVELDDADTTKFALGQSINLHGWLSGAQASVGVYDSTRQMIGIGGVQATPSGAQLKPSKVFAGVCN